MNRAGIRVEPLVDEGLGNSAYLVDLGEGRALAVDATRDLRSVRALADRRGLTIAYAADTHLHADFLSGAVQLAATDGAVVLASAAGDRAFPHRGMRDGDEVDLGGLALRAWATPGHTEEHLAFLLLDDDEPVGVFTGGSLIAGAAARTDLVAPGRTEDLARAQYQSLQRLMLLPDDVAVWPTHGAGSFCSAPPGAERTSTVGRERATNSLLSAPTEDEFVTRLLGSLGTFPSYFGWLGEANRRGPAVLPEPQTITALAAGEVQRLIEQGAAVVDVRPIDQYAEAHLPGSVSIQLRPAFSTWLGWLLPHDARVVVVRNQDQHVEEILGQAAKVGYDIVGELEGGVDAWTASGRATTWTATVTATTTGNDESVLDVRQEAEFTAGHIPGALHRELGALETASASLPEGPVTVMCGHGERAMSAASVLERAGRPKVRVLLGGPAQLAAARGVDLIAGP